MEIMIFVLLFLNILLLAGIIMFLMRLKEKMDYFIYDYYEFMQEMHNKKGLVDIIDRRITNS